MEPLPEIHLKVTRQDYDWSTYPDFSGKSSTNKLFSNPMKRVNRKRGQNSTRNRNRKRRERGNGKNRRIMNTNFDFSDKKSEIVESTVINNYTENNYVNNYTKNHYSQIVQIDKKLLNLVQWQKEQLRRVNDKLKKLSNLSNLTDSESDIEILN